MMAIIEMLNSLPPIWSDMSEHGSLGTFLGGTTVAIKVTAQDPEGNSIRYEKVSGAFPPGVVLNKVTGEISGVTPDIDAVYEFGIRATDNHGKHADQTFTILTREKNQCRVIPCKNGGSCIDDIDDYSCDCPSAYGGKNCQLDCVNNAVGVDVGLMHIPDAQMSAHYSHSDYAAWNGRLKGSGWVGEKVVNSWLQIDLGSVMEWFAVTMQGAVSSSFYTTTYTMAYSEDGDNFQDVKDAASNTMIFNGSTLFNAMTKTVLLRLYRPGMFASSRAQLPRTRA
ncbi:EGF-like repeat and discoidin I-like domain-containing protein 3 [Haliotis rubra]|uniref:EGF-like repeat and discoidin I-like domain-containing protein 3 n=1 Tax=Haliotis rubra TaxID=36100 RepID=UPI001EE62583|nr:EGF-like repeat and discoidin I-like domain-containing protein 3 [Haliotis rubra]